MGLCSFNKTGYKPAQEIEALYDRKIAEFLQGKTKSQLSPEQLDVLTRLEHSKYYDPRYPDVCFGLEEEADIAIKIADRLNAMSEIEFLNSSYPYMWLDELPKKTICRITNDEAKTAINEILQQSKLFPEEDVAKTVKIVMASTRPMPAHFTTNEGKSQSFCVDFDIYWEDEYNMASMAWRNAVVAFGKARDEYSGSGAFVPIIKIGEDIMLGAYILEKVGGSALIGKLVNEILVKNKSWVDQSPEIDSPPIQEYIQTCWKYSMETARIKRTDLKPPEDLGRFYTDNPNLRYK